MLKTDRHTEQRILNITSVGVGKNPFKKSTCDENHLWTFFNKGSDKPILMRFIIIIELGVTWRQ